MNRVMLFFFIVCGCQDFSMPKQKAYFAHKFNIPSYKEFSNDCYKFQINSDYKVVQIYWPVYLTNPRSKVIQSVFNVVEKYIQLHYMRR